MGAQTIMRRPAITTGIVLVSFLAGLFSHVLYQRWNPPAGDQYPAAANIADAPSGDLTEPKSYPVNFAPLSALSAPEEPQTEFPVVVARDVEKIRALTGKQARVRGRVFRVGHSAKSNTYFLNFGPSRESLTAVIFASTAELFEKNQQAPSKFENREVEITGAIKDHPQYGLEIIVEHPKQLKIVN